MTSSQSLSLVEAAQAFAAIGSEARLDVVRILVRAGRSGLSMGELQKRLDIPASTLTHHIKFLISAGLVEQERQGRSIISHAQFDRINALSDFLVTECCRDECSDDQDDTADDTAASPPTAVQACCDCAEPKDLSHV